MAIAYVGSASNAVAASTSVTTNYVSTGGMLFAVLSGVTTIVNAATQIVDSAGNIWMAVSPVTSSQFLAIYCTQLSNPAAITSVTVSGVVSSNLVLSILEYTGVADVRPYSVTNVNATSTTPSISATLNAANNWILAVMSHTGTSAGVFTAATGNLRLQVATTTTQRNAVVDNTAASITSVTCSATIVSQAWSCAGIELVAVQNLNIVHLTDLAAAGGTNTFVTPSISPALGDLILMSIKITTVTPVSGVLGPPVVTGCNMTWRMAILGGPIGTRKLFIFYAIAGAGATIGALTASWTANVGNDFTASVERVRGFDTTSMINWVVQEQIQLTPTTSIHAPSMTMLSLQNSSSLVYGICYSALSAANWGPGIGWNQLFEASAALSTIWKVNDNVPNWTNAGATTIDEICAIEITAANTFQRNNPLQPHMLASSGAGQ